MSLACLNPVTLEAGAENELLYSKFVTALEVGLFNILSRT
jgi:hypothetical protein